MSTHTRPHRLTITRIFICTALLTFSSAPAYAADASTATFELRPHCDSTAYATAFGIEGSSATPDSDCKAFSVKDPKTLQTDILKKSDTLDMDLVVKNPSKDAVTRFRAWIAYDPATLIGDEVTIAKTFGTPMPGETGFSATDGIVRISGSADNGKNDDVIVVARIRMHKSDTATDSSPLSFSDVSGTNESHTGIFSTGVSGEANITAPSLSSLLVRFEPSAAVQSSSVTNASSVRSERSSNASVSSADSIHNAATLTPLTSPTIFTLLQVQKVGVTTEGSSVFIAWDTLPSSEIIGYNVYYGTVSGKYMQKRSLDKTTTNVTIRDLTQGVTYYFAVRAINAKNLETDFSQEVGVTVGNPSTSTSPLVGSVLSRPPKTPKTGGTVSGETGTSSTLLLFFTLSAVIGTGIAFRRQLTARAHL